MDNCGNCVIYKDGVAMCNSCIMMSLWEKKKDTDDSEPMKKREEQEDLEEMNK